MVNNSSSDLFTPVLPDLKMVSKFDVVVDKSGQLYLFYTNELSSNPEYAEYDSERNILCFVDGDGCVQNSGITLKTKTTSYLLSNKTIILVKVNEDHSLGDCKNIQLIAR